METTQRSFALHLPGLLKVLAEHLYSNRQVALRELIQNAHDSCQRRRMAEPAGSNWSPLILLRVDEKARQLTIEDNGCGLTADEVVTYLATIGRSGTRETREGLALHSPEEAAALIGQFGLGFLSAFLLASEVELTSRSTQPGADAVHWRCSGEADYELSAGERAAPGTTITLTVKPEASYLLQPGAVDEAVRRFADFLPIPIFRDGYPAQLNLGEAPWDAGDPESAARSYIKRAFRTDDPLCTIELVDSEVRTDAGETVKVGLRGLLFIPPGSVASVREWGDLHVYIRHMFIRDGEKLLLPPWARFVRGVVDAADLQPTASREDIHQDGAYLLVKRAIEEQLGEALEQIARERPATWRRIVEGHTDILMGWAVRDDAFFQRVAELLTVRTSRGPMTIPDYLDASGGDLYYVTRELGSLQERLLAESRGVPVIDASWFAVAPFLDKWSHRARGAGLVALDSETEALLRPCDPGPLRELVDFFDRRGVEAQTSRFAPEETPALMLYARDAEFVREGTEALSKGEIADPIAALIGDEVFGLAARTNTSGTLYLNAANPLVRHLAAAEPGPARDAALTVIWQTARLFSGRMLSAGDAAEAFGELSRALGRLL